jgi:two-component system cell cycle sensor histidine kinase/response regulator CckA
LSLDLDMPNTAKAAPERRPLVDPLALAAAVFFILAVAAVAYPALRAGPISGPLLLLLIGIAGVALAVVFAFISGDTPVREAAPRLDLAPALVTSLSEPASVARADGRIVSANPAWREVVGVASRLPKSGSDLYAALLQAKRKGSAEIPWKGRTLCIAGVTGGLFLVRLMEAPAPVGDAAAPSATAAALPAPPAALDAFAAAAPFGAALLEGADPFDAVILQANGALLSLSGGKADAGARFGDLLEPAGLTEAAERLAAKPGSPVEVRLKDSGGKVAHLYLTKADGRLVAYLIDVSEHKQLELQLAQSQKMQAIGQLAGGVAHDFNNLLMAIQLHLSELLQRHPVGDPSYEGLNEIRQTAVRAADLVRKLLAFSRKQTVQRETLELGELISEFEVLLRRLLREDVRLENAYGRDLPLVRADKSQLETAVMNLAVNARDALRSHGTGDGGPAVVRIRVARLPRMEAVTLGYPGCPDEGCALIEVSDNGPGIPPEVMDKIFEPFFTTKPLHEGTGLGLATVYGIVKQADGWIWVESEPGHGAAFRIFLPLYNPPAVAEGVAAPIRAPLKFKPATPRDLSGAGRILFVEDEDAVRTVAARLLRARGYEVIEAADGEEALELAEQHAGEIDLLISDVVMPGLDGPALLKKARPFLGDAKVMFISGYAEAEFSDLLEGETDITFVAKPIDIKVLAERVKQQLQS